MTVLLQLQNLSMLSASSTRPSGNSLGLVGQRIMLNVLGGNTTTHEACPSLKVVMQC